MFFSKFKGFRFHKRYTEEIELTDAKPIVYRPYRLSAPERQTAKNDTGNDRCGHSVRL